MRFLPTVLAGAYVIDVEPFVDERGMFARTFCQREFAEIGFHDQIVQINHSATKKKGTIRGMHYQIPPASETKIVRCIRGTIFDVMVDIRAGSPTFMQWYGIELSKKNMRMVFIPVGFAHGFQALSDNVEIIYHHSVFYNQDLERGLRFDDPALAIKWPSPVGPVSPKDQNCPLIDNNFAGIGL